MTAAGLENAGGIEVHVLCGAQHPASRARFESEAAHLGVGLRWLDPHVVTLREGGLAHGGIALSAPRVVLARSGGYTTDRALSALRAYEQLGVAVIDSVEAVERCRDKHLCASVLSAAGLPVPRTVSVGGVGGVDSVASAVALLGPPPLVVKPSRGMKGEGVLLAADEVELEAALLPSGALHPPGALLVQEYVPHDHDVRVIVVGGEPLGAIERVPVADFRSNLHVGSTARLADLTEEAGRVAVMAAAAVGAEIAGVDMLPGEDGYVVLEVNSSPGFDGFESATGTNVARAILVHALSRT